MVSVDFISFFCPHDFPFFFQGVSGSLQFELHVTEGSRVVIVIEEHHKERLNAVPY